MMSTRELNRNVLEMRKIKLVSPDNFYSLQFTIESGQEAIIGRSDANIAFYPAVDLSNVGAYGLGVSRTHAILELIDDTLYITDKSSNGTHVNGQLLTKGEQYPVKSHDTVIFGGLHYHLVIQTMNTALLSE